MKGIYLMKRNSLSYFIESYKEDDFVKMDGDDVAASAFANSCVEKVLLTDYFPKICESAFENCKSLTTVIFGELGNGNDEIYKRGHYDYSILNNVGLTSAPDEKELSDLEHDQYSDLYDYYCNRADYNCIIQANAFKDCEKLTTLILPKLVGEHKLIIGSDAFCGCKALRTVVAICDEIEFTDESFAKANRGLTFVCKKDSSVAQFALAKGYRTVYID